MARCKPDTGEQGLIKNTHSLLVELELGFDAWNHLMVLHLPNINLDF
jgi:hypothetical protein